MAPVVAKASVGPVVETKRVSLAQLHFYPGNARLHDDELIADSLRAHGQYKALVVQKSTMYVLVGNGTLHGLHEIGAKDALCHFVDVDDVEARKINLIDNRAGDRAKYDNGLLVDLLQGLDGNLLGTGYDGRDLAKLLGDDGGMGFEDPPESKYKEQYGVIVVCTSESEQERVYEELRGHGYECRVVTT